MTSPTALSQWMTRSRTGCTRTSRRWEGHTTPGVCSQRNENQTSQQQQVPFVTISRHEKGKSLGEVLYEERVYPPGTWACVSKADTLYEQSISNAFMKLMRLICKENSTGRYLGMSVPVDVLTAYYLPAELQTRPPEPTDPDIRIVHRDAIRVIARYTNTLPRHMGVSIITSYPDPLGTGLSSE
uniref:Heme-binding protein soul4 n=1 Tax=Cyprinus carpio TaxID=7962 RepID=A0A8C2JKD7_CYPCA